MQSRNSVMNVNTNRTLHQFRIERFAIFQGLDGDGLANLARACEAETFQPGACILRECDFSDDLFIIVDGTVALGHDLDQPQIAYEITRSTAGDVFGELSWLDGLPRALDALAVTPATVMRLRRERWLELAEEDPALAWRFTVNIARFIGFRLRTANWELSLVKAGTSKQA